MAGEYCYVYLTELPGTGSSLVMQAHQRSALNPFCEDERTHPSQRVGQTPIIPAFTVSPLSSHVNIGTSTAGSILERMSQRTLHHGTLAHVSRKEIGQMAIPGPDFFSFGTLLKGFRTRRRLTQEQLAQAISVHRSAVNRWEQGEFLPKQKGIVLELARCLKLDEQETRQLLEASLTALAPYWSVPLPRNPYFTGREEILDVLHTHLATNRIVALTQSYALQGLGGIGKTQLALEYTYRHALEYSAVFWIEAETEETAISSLLHMADILQLSERKEADQQRVVAAVQRWLSSHSGWLLIWDNVENLDVLSRLLPATIRQGAILLTTRAQALGTLALGMDLTPLEHAEGTLFVLRRAKVLEPEAVEADVQRFAARWPGEYAAAGELVRTTGGLPLALDQAGAYIEETGCGFAGYVQRYRQKRHVLLDRRGLASDHPDSIVATIRLACQRVGEQQPAALELVRCCAFLYPEAIPEELLLAGADYLGPVLGAAVRAATEFDLAVATLRRYSLVQRHPETHMLSLHRLVQVILQEDMTGPEREQWQQRLVHLLSAVFPVIPAETKVELWGQCERLLPHAMSCAVTIPEHLHDRELAEMLLKVTRYLFKRSQYQQASFLCEHALHLFEQTLGPDHLQVALVLHSLAAIYRWQGKYEQAVLQHQRSLRIREQVLGPKHPCVAASLNNLAFVYRERGEYEQAEPLFQRALRIREETLGPMHLDVAFSLHNLAILNRERGKGELAEPLYQRSIHILEQALGPEHPDVARPLNNLAVLYKEQGKYEQAKPLAERAVSLFEQAFGREHLNVAFALDTLADVYREEGRYQEAQALYQRSIYILEQALDPEHLQVAYPLVGLANLFREQGNYVEAESRYQRALSIREQHLGHYHPETAQTLHELAILHQRKGQVDAACSLAERALATHARSLGETHPKTVVIRSLYSQLVQEQQARAVEEPACGQPADPQARAGGQEHLPGQVMRVAVRGAAGQVAYTRLVRMRDVTFTCIICGQTVTQLHHPSGQIKYCSQACRAISAAQRQQVRVAKQREQRRIARGARSQAQQGKEL
jgi:tetratricopeptide (TPR) repeat protein